MTKIIEIKNMHFAYNNTNAFNDFNMEIEEGEIVTLIGPSGSGKTTLLKILCHKLPNYGCYFNGRPFSSYNPDTLKRMLVTIFDTPFITSNIKDELSYHLRSLHISESEIENRLQEIKKHFDLGNLTENNLNQLSFNEQYLIKLLRYLIVQPKFLAIDSILSNLNHFQKENFFAYIKEYKITLLNVTSNLDDALYGDRISVLENFVMILEGNTISVLKTDTLLKRLGFKLPLAVDLSIELNHYDIMKKIYTDKDKLVRALWK